MSFVETSDQFLGQRPVGQLLRQYAVPCVISLLVGALYNIVDQLFIANASYLGSFGNAANTVVFPLTVVALAVAVMIGDGCCAFVSISLGRGDIERARKSVGSAVALAIVSSLVLTALYLALADPLVTLFGGRVNEETFGYAQEYLFYITLGLPFYMFGQAMNPVIRADGSPKFAMAATLAGAAVNIVLDPLFIFPLGWGMMGAAVATVAGQGVTALLSAYFLAGDAPRLRALAARHVPEEWRARGGQLLVRLRAALRGYVLAQGKLLLVTFGVVSLGLLAALRRPHAVLLGALIAVVDALPVLGSGTVLLPWAAVSLLRGSGGLAIGLTVTYAAAAFARSALEPRLLGRQIGLPPLLTLLSLYAGYRLFGLAGMILLPLAVLLAKQVWELAEGNGGGIDGAL